MRLLRLDKNDRVAINQDFLLVRINDEETLSILPDNSASEDIIGQ